MRSAAVLPTLGIGDALLMMIASHQLKKQGCQVSTFHDTLPELSSWFPDQDLQPLPSLETLIKTVCHYDLILVENDNTPKIRSLIEAFRSRLSIFYPTYLPGKHAPLSPLDKVFDPDLPMADNIASATMVLCQTKMAFLSKENGLTPLPALIHRRNKDQVLIHPTSRMPAKNWKMEGFLKVASKLCSKGMKPIFCVSPLEKSAWSFIEKEGFDLADTPSLSHLASLIYESGVVIGNDSLIGHLASNLHIPTLIIANDMKRMRLWRPGWLKAELLLPPSYLPNWKLLRLRENHWQSFISAKKVLRALEEIKLS
jgi:heptosyltransferase-3